MNECNSEPSSKLRTPRCPGDDVEVVRVVPCERVQQQAAECTVDKSIPPIREECVAVVENFPQEPISERMYEQREVIEVTETASQDWNLQHAVEHTFLDLVEAVKIVCQERISETMCEQLGVVEVPKKSSQESVGIVKIILQEQMSERTREQIRVIEVPKVSGQESVVVVTIVPQERISERMGEQSEVIDVTKISSQGPSLLRIVEQMIYVTKISDLDQGWQRTVKHFLDDTRHEPISRISASVRELRSILSLFEMIREKKERRWLQ